MARVGGDRDAYRYLSVFGDALQLMRSHYVEQLADDDLLEGAFEGMVSGLDGFSAYLTSEERVALELPRPVGGTGLVVLPGGGGAVIVKVREGSPAGEAGLKPGDQISVRFTETANTWDHDTMVRPDGMAAFMAIDDLQVAGLTFEELDARLEEDYGAVLQQPEVTVLPLLLSGRKVTVIGEVRRPGELVLEDPQLTLLEAIGRAGGPIQGRASMQNVLLVRWVPAEARRRAWKIDSRPGRWTEKGAIFLQPSDVVYVPPRVIVKVNDWVDRFIVRNIPFPRFFIPV